MEKGTNEQHIKRVKRNYRLSAVSLLYYNICSFDILVHTTVQKISLYAGLQFCI